MHTFYISELSVGLQVLNEEESSHCARVLRLGAGAAVRLVDGRGGVGEGVLHRVGHREVEVRVDRVDHVGGSGSEGVWIAFAPPKSIDRVEWLVEKVVEVGVGRITPFVAARSERRAVRLDRLERVALSALKQSLGVYMPSIDPLTSWSGLVGELGSYSGSCYVAHLSSDGETPLLHEAYGGGRCCVLIGPEGGFTEEEVSSVVGCGGQMVSLGARRLRVETAALASCVLANVRINT